MTVENINGANIVRALEVANALRAEFGAEKLEDLPAGTHGSESCVLARAFNFNCAVSFDASGWYVRLDEEAHARKLAELVGALAQKNLFSWRVHLPKDVGHIARLFDARKLPGHYYEDEGEAI